MHRPTMRMGRWALVPVQSRLIVSIPRSEAQRPALQGSYRVIFDETGLLFYKYRTAGDMTPQGSESRYSEMDSRSDLVVFASSQYRLICFLWFPHF